MKSLSLLQWTESGKRGPIGTCVVSRAVALYTPGTGIVPVRSTEEPTAPALLWKAEIATPITARVRYAIRSQNISRIFTTAI